jgi:cell division protein FtsA
MKVQFGSALSNETKTNAYITHPRLRGMPAKEISVKNLANIIQARMSELMDFVSYHLKQVGLDNRMLNGGIVLTGGGGQLKTSHPAYGICNRSQCENRISDRAPGSGHIEELAKPTYSTCIGLILKGLQRL